MNEWRIAAKRLIYATWRPVLSSLLTVGLLILAFVVLRRNLSGILSPSASGTATPSAPSTTTVITSTLSYGDALKTYEVVATSAIHASERAMDTIKWLVGAFFGLIVVATTVAAYLYKTTKETGEKAQLAAEAAQAAKEAAALASGQLEKLSERYIVLSDQYLELRGKTLSLDAALHAWDRGEIPRDQVVEIGQWHSWIKWTQQKDDTGWQELLEDACHGGGLHPNVRSAVERELEKVRQKAKARTQSDEEKGYQKRLQRLLDPLSVE